MWLTLSAARLCTAAVSAAAALGVLTGCGHTTPVTGGGHASASAGASSAATTTATGAPTGSARSCPAGDTPATIHGAAKCLRAGQQCSTTGLADYPQYGFVCEQSSGGTYLLRKR